MCVDCVMGQRKTFIYFLLAFSLKCYGIFLGMDGSINKRADVLVERIHNLDAPNLTRERQRYRKVIAHTIVWTHIWLEGNRVF